MFIISPPAVHRATEARDSMITKILYSAQA